MEIRAVFFIVRYKLPRACLLGLGRRFSVLGWFRWRLSGAIEHINHLGIAFGALLKQCVHHACDDVRVSGAHPLSAVVANSHELFSGALLAVFCQPRECLGATLFDVARFHA